MLKYKKVKQFVFITVVTVATVTAGTTSLARADAATKQQCTDTCFNDMSQLAADAQAKFSDKDKCGELVSEFLSRFNLTQIRMYQTCAQWCADKPSTFKR